MDYSENPWGFVSLKISLKYWKWYLLNVLSFFKILDNFSRECDFWFVVILLLPYTLELISRLRIIHLERRDSSLFSRQFGITRASKLFLVLICIIRTWNFVVNTWLYHFDNLFIPFSIPVFEKLFFIFYLASSKVSFKSNKSCWLPEGPFICLDRKISWIQSFTWKK